MTCLRIMRLITSEGGRDRSVKWNAMQLFVLLVMDDYSTEPPETNLKGTRPQCGIFFRDGCKNGKDNGHWSRDIWIGLLQQID